MDVIDDGEKRLLDQFARSWDRMPRDRGPLVIDVGANRGEYSAEVLDRLPDASIYCFEPQHSALRILKDRFSERSNVGIHPIGMSSDEGLRELRTTTNEACVLGTLTDRPTDTYDEGVKLAVTERIAVQRLDATCWDLGIEYVDLLKIDTEGHDYEVLLGAGPMIASVSVIQFEFNATTLAAGWSFLDFWNLLNDEHELWRLDTDSTTTLVSAYGEQHEERLPQRNYAAIKRDQVWFKL